MKPSSEGVTYAFCTVCNVDISVASGGVNQVKRHCENAKHMKLAATLPAQPLITLARHSQPVIRPLQSKLLEQNCTLLSL